MNTDKIQTLSQQFNAALDDYKKAYIAYKLNPEMEQYQSTLNNTESTITSINKDMFVLTNNVESQIESLNMKTEELDKKINVERKTHDKLRHQYTQLTGTDMGSIQMIDDSKDMYRKQYISNWTMLLGILIIAITMIRIFSHFIVRT